MDRRDFVKAVGAASLAVVPGGAAVNARLQDIADAAPNLSDPSIANRIEAVTLTTEAVNARLQNIADAAPNLLDPEKPPVRVALEAFDVEAQDTLQTSAQIRAIVNG